MAKQLGKKRLVIGALTAALACTTMTSAAFGDDSVPREKKPTAPAAVNPYTPMERSEWTVEPGPVPAGLSAASPAEDVIPVVADRIFTLGADSGFARQETNYAKRSVKVLWKGEPPANVRAYAAEKPLGVRITLTKGAKYSRAEAEAARTRVLNSPLSRSMGVTWSELNKDGSGVTVGVASRARIAGARAEEVRETAGIPDVEIRTGVPAAEPLSRQNDSPPWSGGIRLRHPQGLCTSGFSVLAGGGGRLLSAGHCDTTGNGAITDGAGQSISPGGTAVARLGEIDSLLIDPSASPATIANIFRGGYNSNTKSNVKSWASNWPGDSVCSSGASTGEHCGTVYDDSDVYFIEGHYVGVVQVAAPAGQIFGGQGDSGGPVFRTVSGGVQARGILISADLTEGSMTYACGTTDPAAGPIQCSRWVNYVPISTILNTWGATLEVG
ncbi:S1 family peptidase [Streptomyces sp. CAU 1734]|uniref:S1 family peptidase n=1 Tax=Streptomyces sp. CAU 1734 TaxID=3140360 RepID=UPI0032618D17